MRIEEFNALPAAEAADALAVCVRIDSWVGALLRSRPYGDSAALLRAARTQAARWTPGEIAAALADHPRIGERSTGPATDTPTAAHSTTAHSTSEQAGVDPGDRDLAAALRAGNLAYEQRFDRIYLVRAKGRTGAQMLALLEQRLDNSPAAELAVVHEQLAQIALLRLADLFAVGLDPADFEDDPVLPHDQTDDDTGEDTGVGAGGGRVRA